MPREIEQVRRALRTARARLPDLFAPGTRLVVGFSGGQDSACLLHALAHSHLNLQLIAAHVDHSLRAESADDAQRARDLALAIGASRCEVTRVDVAGYRARTKRRWSVEQAARAARYRALASVVRDQKAAALLVAHTADDQAESLLLHLLRGSGLTGLSGMRLEQTLELDQIGPPIDPRTWVKTPLRVVRPLLKVPRPTTLAYCTHFGLSLVDDASNRTRRFTRNRVRLDLLPVLASFNPAIKETLARTAELAAEDDAALGAIVDGLEKQLREDHSYDLASWRAQPRALQRRLLRLGLEELLGGKEDVTDAPIEDALDLLQSGQPRQTYHLPYGVELCIGFQNFSLQLHGRARRRERVIAGKAETRAYNASTREGPTTHGH